MSQRKREEKFQDKKKIFHKNKKKKIQTIFHILEGMNKKVEEIISFTWKLTSDFLFS